MAAQLRLALDQNFPLPVINRIIDFLPASLQLASLQQIDPRLTSLDDRPLIIALSQLGWDGLITNNYKMLYQPHEVAAVVATRSVLVAVEGLGHDPLRATGAFLLDLPGLEHRLVAGQASVFLLRHDVRRATRAWDYLEKTAARRHQETRTLWRRYRPTQSELQTPVL